MRPDVPQLAENALEALKRLRKAVQVELPGLALAIVQLSDVIEDAVETVQTTEPPKPIANGGWVASSGVQFEVPKPSEAEDEEVLELVEGPEG